MSGPLVGGGIFLTHTVHTSIKYQVNIVVGTQCIPIRTLHGLLERGGRGGTLNMFKKRSEDVV